MEPYAPRRYFANRLSTTGNPLTNGSTPSGFNPTQSSSSSSTSPSNTIGRTIPTTTINRPYLSSSSSSAPISSVKRPSTSLASIGVTPVSTSQSEVQSSLKDLKKTMTDIDSLSAQSSLFASDPTRSFRSTNKLLHGSTPAFMKRIETSPAMMVTEPSSTNNSSPGIQYCSTRDSVDIDEILDQDGSMSNGSGPMPIITSPDMDFSDSESGLTSPNLVSSMNPSGLSLALVAGGNSNNGGGMMGTAAKLSVCNNTYEARKMSSSSTKTIMSSSETEKGSRLGDMTDSALDLKRLQHSFMSTNEAVMKESSISSVAAASSTALTATGAATTAGGLAAAKVESFRSQNSQHSSSSQRQVLTSNGIFTHESHHHEESHSSKKFSKSTVTRTASLLSNSQIDQTMKTKMTLEELEKSFLKFDDLESLTSAANIQSVESTLFKYGSVLSNTVETMKRDVDSDSVSMWLAKVNKMMTKAWEVPAFGYEMGNTLCDIFRKNGGMDILIDYCGSSHKELQFNSAKLLQQCLITENRGYVVEKGLKKVMDVAKLFTDKDNKNVEQARVGTGILEHLFKHSETTCSEVIAMGGLDTVINECKSHDKETLRHCASALANVAMYGGAENQEAMIKRKVPSWLFPLAFHFDDTVKYYACLAIAALVSNKEIEAAVQKSGTLDLIEPFIQKHTPAEFALTSAIHSHGQSINWLKRLIPVLMSQREEARNLAAFHFCMEAEIKKQQGKIDHFQEIGAIDSLKKVASSPSGIASKYAAQTLRLIGEEVPHKLSQQVPTWSVEDVKEWVKQIGFPGYADSFGESRVDGDLLLLLTEENLRDDIGIRNGILRKRFMRELNNLKRVADYSSCDPTNLNGFLQTLGQEYSVYTYALINNAIDKDTLLGFNEEHYLADCGVSSKIHQIKILQGVKVERGDLSPTDNCSLDKSLDIFISYRRSNGSQLASLLKVHLEIRNFSVFLDVDRLEAGKFDNNLLQSIRSAKFFILVLTPGALDRCVNDDEQRDWIHKEVACALSSNCNIIPVLDNFTMPNPDELPETMRAVTSYNGVKWIHDYQDACVDKIDRFIRGGDNGVMERFLNSQPCGTSSYGGSTANTSQPSYNRQCTYQRTISIESKTNSSCSDDTGQTSSGKE